MKKIITILICLLATLTFFGCDDGSGGDNGDGKTSITFFGWGSAEEQANYQELVNEFMRQNDDISVVYSAVSSDMYMRNLKNKINNLPDVFYMPDTEFMQWADAGRLLSLDDYVSATELSDVWPLAREHYLYDRTTYELRKGSLYALPKDLGPFAMAVNKDLFNKMVEENNSNVSLPDKSIPIDWNAFIEVCKGVTGTLDGSKIYGVSHYELAAAVYSNNADFFDSQAKNQTINSKNFIDAVQFIADLDLVHHVMPDANAQASTNGYQRFMNGGAVFSFVGPWDLKGFWNNVSFEFDLIPMPVGTADGAKSTAWIGSMGIAVSAKTKEKEAAVKLAKFLTISEDSQKLNYQLGQAIPNLMTMANGDYINNVGLTGRQTLPENKQMFLSIVGGNEFVQGKPRTTYYTYENVWYDDFVTELVNVYNGSKSANDFLTSYAKTLQEGLDESYSYLQ